ncbi:PREDICTED: protein STRICTOSIDINE SYNTHASE-LIKE 2-like isoform X1 [Camelina sativa]|uniref:Protein STRICTOSIDINE SYNTHASE-LIKE 2-like isoform X1 n=1 Tax=Camelina sativa TaxID=90675 RepID=A0ABM0YU45_CAMSA|nr:PREDICTED: protein STRICTOSIDINE SYNTHASE-LIKE 2-like isoform X1 [Camelina sativa]
MMKLFLVVAISVVLLFNLTDFSGERPKDGESMMSVHLPDFRLIPTTGASGPESFVFDISGDGPYTGLSDGRIVKWLANDSRWIDFAVTTSTREGCEGSHEHQRTEHVCGRPLGLSFDESTGDLYIADAYMGLLKVGLEGGVATRELDEPLRFTNGLDIDPRTGIVYFTDSSSVYQRRNYIGVMMSGDRTGRLMKYDPNTKQVTTLLSNLTFANGVVLSQNGDYLLVVETATCRILRYWLNDTSTTTATTRTPESRDSYEVFAERLPGFPDNIKRSPRGGFWVGLNTKHSKLTEFAMSNAWLGRAALGLPVDWMKVHSYWAKYKGNGMAVRLSEGSSGVVISEVFEGKNGNKWISISEVEERDGTLWVGSVNTPFAGMYKF